jgi:hypothetical protein
MDISFRDTIDEFVEEYPLLYSYYSKNGSVSWENVVEYVNLMNKREKTDVS